LVETEKGKTGTAEAALDFKGAAVAVLRALKGLDLATTREVLEFCLEAIAKAD
jgi:hypothetical protein